MYEEDFNTEDKPAVLKRLLKVSRRTLLGVALIALLVIGAFAVYKITSDDSEPVEVVEPATLSQPSVNATTAVPSDTIQITTTLSDGAEGLQVFFYENDAQIGSAYTNSEGTAIFNRVVSAIGTYVYHCECTHP